jgi:hypothetical protein
MDKEIVIDGASTAVEILGMGPVASIAKGWIAYRHRRQILEAKEGLEQLFQFISLRKQRDNKEVSDSEITTLFEKHNIAVELLDDMVSKLLNTPNELTRPFIVWIYSRHIIYLEKPSRIAVRLIRLLLDCDKDDLDTLLHLAENMRFNWHEGMKRSIIRVNIEGKEMIPRVYMSISEDIDHVMRVFEQDDESKWVKWNPDDYYYSAMVDMLKRFGVTREVPMLSSGTANTKSHMYLNKEAATLISDTFSCPITE